MEWNPITHPYCRGCPFYQSVGQFIYELERDPSKRKCKFLRQCGRIAKMQAPAKDAGAAQRQASLEDTADGRPPRDTVRAKQNGGKLK